MIGGNPYETKPYGRRLTSRSASRPRRSPPSNTSGTPESIDGHVVSTAEGFDHGGIEVGAVHATAGESDRHLRSVGNRPSQAVVGLPGDSVGSANNLLYVSDHPPSEPYLPAGTVTTGNFSQAPECKISAAARAGGACLVPSGEYWVMGDNRGDSKDSRSFGPIRGSSVVGRGS